MMDEDEEDETLEGDAARAAFMKDVKKALRVAGFPFPLPSFPYGMHHNFYRAKIRVDGKKIRHFGVACLLLEWMKTRSEPADYAWQCVTGAIKEMIAKDPTLVTKIPQDIRKGMASVEDGYAFLRWVTSIDVTAIVRS
jgi:hypothetical protein